MPYKDPKAKRAYDAFYRAEHREERAAYNAAYYAVYNAAHREEKAAHNAVYNAAHCEEKAAAAAAYYATHRAELLAYNAAYAKANPDKVRDKEATRRARKADAFIEAIDRQVVFARDQGTCGICQTAVAPEGWHLDHKQPLSKGGQHSYDNVQVSHPVCNLRKGNKI
jgi:5-methylcytosine-specific restriction endonuclease McrA